VTTLFNRQLTRVRDCRIGTQRFHEGAMSKICRTIRFLLLAAGLATITDASQGLAADSSSLSPPAEARLLLRTVAEGVQIYTCTAQAAAPVWTLKAPEAVLHDATGKQVVGKHFSGPTWQANDGSTVVGEVAARADAPRGDAIPWLLLRARSHSGAGLFAEIAFVQRIDTVGGLAPPGGCEPGTLGSESRVPYSATYLFYAAR
jgi:hypothetical protein